MLLFLIYVTLKKTPGCGAAGREGTGFFVDAQQRRLEIARRLQQADAPISATTLAQELSVSRQIIVGDVALLRAGGLEITATPRGYLLPKADCAVVCTFACRHRSDQMEEELNAMVDQGCTVLDVIVEHPVYGQLTAPIHVSNRYEVSQFIQRCRQSEAVPLSQLTEGLHLHTVSCRDQQSADRVRQALEQLGFLYE